MDENLNPYNKENFHKEQVERKTAENGILHESSDLPNKSGEQPIVNDTDTLYVQKEDVSENTTVSANEQNRESQIKSDIGQGSQYQQWGGEASYFDHSKVYRAYDSSDINRDRVYQEQTVPMCEQSDVYDTPNTDIPQFSYNNQQGYWSGQGTTFYGWQYGEGFQPPIHSMPNKQPSQKVNLGMKIFLIILSVLAIGFILGFTVFGAFVVLQQNDYAAQQKKDTSSDSFSKYLNQDQSISDLEAQVPDKTNPDFVGMEILPATGQVMTPEQVYQQVSASMVSILAVTGTESSALNQGSGIIATSDGYIITNAHVLSYTKAAQVSVFTHDQKQYEGIVVGFDKDSDLAVIKIEEQGLSAAMFGNADELAVGETVIAIGDPGGLRYSGSMTMGIISALNRSVESYSNTGITYIQTDTAINPGNSGGGLINMRGQVVGINTIKVVASGYEGMGFSISINQAKSILDTIIREGSIPPVGRLGIMGGTQYLPVEGQSYSVAGGVLVSEIDSDSPLNDTALQQGDLIIGFNGTEIVTLEDIYAQLKEYRVGQEITLTIRRISQEKDTVFEVTTNIMERAS